MNEAMKREMERRNESAAWHHARMKEECQTLTEEQHDVLSWLCEIRHDLHSEDREKIWDNNSSVLDPFFNGCSACEVNGHLEEVGLKPIDIDSDFFMDLPNSTDYEYMLSDEEREEWESKAEKFNEKHPDSMFHSGLSLWKEESGEYIKFCDMLEDLNKSIEDYLRKIDEVHHTQYAPSGKYRNADISGNKEVTIPFHSIVSEADKKKLDPVDPPAKKDKDISL